MQFISTSRRAKNDGKTMYKLNVKDVPVDGFWSISLYNAKGYLEKNETERVFVQQHHREEDDRWFGYRFSLAAAAEKSNCLPTMPGWNYTVRLYRPRKEILNGTWKFPERSRTDTITKKK